MAMCPYEFYKKWITDPEGTRDMVEALTRSTVGTDGMPDRRHSEPEGGGPSLTRPRVKGSGAFLPPLDPPSPSGEGPEVATRAPLVL